MFNAYTVYGAKVEAIIQNTTANTTMMAGLLVIGSAANTAYATKYMREIPGNMIKCSGPIGDNATINMFGYYDIMECRNREGDGSTTLNSLQTTLFGSNPGNDLFLHVFVKRLDESTASFTATLNIKITFYCLLNDINEEAAQN